MTYLLDSSVLIDVLNGKRGRDALLQSLLEDGHSLAYCPINVIEVYAGIKPNEQARIEEIFDGMEYHEITREIATAAGRLKRHWARRGIALALADVTIASVALANDLTLITDNLKDYPMPELKLYRLPYVH